MSTYTTMRRAIERIAHDNDTSALLELLGMLGRERQTQEAIGGPLFAAFADFCFMTGEPLTCDVFAFWLDAFDGDDQPADAAVTAAREALQGVTA
jgi:hypothetical protein